MQTPRALRLTFFVGCFSVAGLGLGGCASQAAAREFPHTASYALPSTASTSLGRALRDDIKAHPLMSGFHVLATGSDSFAARLALIRAAEKSLDLQYYSMHDDTTANLLLEALIRASRRGVRVRFLIDNISVDEVDRTLSALDGLKNMEVRVFNPVATRDDGLLDRLIKYTAHIPDMNRRMHNKALIADNQMAIMGGRNLGDEYFEENTDMAFRDIDILAAGPIVSDISHSFDDYWNSKDALPMGQLRAPDADPKPLRDALAAHWNEVEQTDRGRKLLRSALHERLKDGDLPLSWARAELAVDRPQKIDTDREDAASPPMRRLGRLVQGAKKEFVAVSPYFVPREEGVAWLRSLVERGIKVKVLTNSLASTDVVAVHTGYSPYRKALLADGIELYEMKPAGGKKPKQRLIGSSAPAHASLHAKVYVVDGKEVMIGSFNLDPRSIELNTEIALVIHSPAIAARMLGLFDDVTSMENSYALSLAEGGSLRWKTEENGVARIYTHDPEAGAWRNIQAGFIGLLPVEEHL